MKLFSVAVPGENSTITVAASTVKDMREYLFSKGYRGDKAIVLNATFFDPEESTIMAITESVGKDPEVAAFAPMVYEALHCMIKHHEKLRKQKERYYGTV